MREQPVLVTGATGYVGSRLVPRLLDAGYRVRAVARDPGKLRSRPWAGHDRLEVARGDLLDQEAMTRAAHGCFAAYYLVHSMKGGSGDFARRDRDAAGSMARASHSAGLERIIYLGGLGEPDGQGGAALSEHLRSRREVAEILQAGSVPVTYLRAAIILGAGSASFEILRYLAERLPVMVTPSWVRTRCQPIAIRNVLGYLTGCLEHPAMAGRTFSICGPDVLTYGELFDLYCDEAGLPRRVVIPVPVLTPWLSSLWINLVTPVSGDIARPLIEGLKNEVVCREHAIRSLIPQELIGCREAIRLILHLRTAGDNAIPVIPKTFPIPEASGYAGPEPGAPERTVPGDASYAGGTVYQCGVRSRLSLPATEAFRNLVGTDGLAGPGFGSLVDELARIAERIIGGPKLLSGPRRPEWIKPGDVVDFWRVLAVEPDGSPPRLRLRAEMGAPGELEVELTAESPDSGYQNASISHIWCELSLTLHFRPKGLFGLAFWYPVPLYHRPALQRGLDTVAMAVEAEAIRAFAGKDRPAHPTRPEVFP